MSSSIIINSNSDSQVPSSVEGVPQQVVVVAPPIREYNYFLESPVLNRLKQLRWFYGIQVFLVFCSCVTQTFLIFGTSASNDLECSEGYTQHIRAMQILQLVLQPLLLLDMFLSRRAVSNFVDSYIQTPDVMINLPLKAFFHQLCSVNSSESENSMFMLFVQVREAMWKVNSIRGQSWFLISHLLSWVLFVSMAYFRLLINTTSTCSLGSKFALTAFEFPYHTVWVVGIEIAAVLVFVVSILVIPFVVCMYFKSQGTSQNNNGTIGLNSQIQIEFQRSPAQIKKDKKEFLEKMIETKQFVETQAKDKMCAICLDEFVENAEIKVAKCCRSEFHALCIQSWVETKPNCPNCRESTKSKFAKATRNANNNSNNNNRVYPMSVPIQPVAQAQVISIPGSNNNEDIENQRLRPSIVIEEQTRVVSSFNEVILPSMSTQIRISREAEGSRTQARSENLVVEEQPVEFIHHNQEERGHNCSINQDYQEQQQDSLNNNNSNQNNQNINSNVSNSNN